MKKPQDKSPSEKSQKDSVNKEDEMLFEEVPVAEIEKAEQDLAKITELTNDLQRTRADFENFRKQVDLQKSQAMAAAQNLTVEKFLPLLDDIDRAIAAYPEQLSPLQKNLVKTMNSLGLQKIDSNPGTEFNPDLHDAVSVEEGEGDREVVSETLRPGYLYHEAVIRPAMVKVSHA